MSGGVTLHTIFWAPPGYTFDSGYEALLKKFLTDSAADSGGTTNMYSVLRSTAADRSRHRDRRQLLDELLREHGLDGRQHALPAVADQCSSPTRHQLRYRRSDPGRDRRGRASSERGLHNIWFVVLPPNVDECITAGVCGSNAFAGYHSLMDVAGGLTIYSVIINR